MEIRQWRASVRNVFTVLALGCGMAGYAEVAESARAVQPLAVGQAIPSVAVQTMEGQEKPLDEILSGRKSIFIVFRGAWCPFCSRHLAGLQEAYAELRKLGYEVYALAPDATESVKTMRGKESIEYSLLTDPNTAAIQALGLAFKLSEETIKKYRGYGIPLRSPPGSEDKVLPVPAVYLVSKEGIVEYAHWQANYKKRLDPEEILAVARGELFTHRVSYEHGDLPLEGYIAYDPSRQGKRPGVLVIHEWWGLNEYPRRRARQLAGMGYVAFAADMYGHGTVAETPKQASELANTLRSDRSVMRARAARGLAELQNHRLVDASRTAAIGFCFGGGCVLELARGGADLQGVVSFHGNLDTPNPEMTETPKASVLVCHGAADPHVPSEDVEAFRKEMHACGADWQLVMYGGAVHAFTNPDSGDDPSTGAAYDPAAAKRAWRHMQQFFDEVLATP